MPQKISLTKKQFKKYATIGNNLIKKKLTTGFQIEDYKPTSKPTLIYGHDNPQHVRTIQKNIGGKTYPRTSFYKWNNIWPQGERTQILQKRTLAYEQGLYLQTHKITKAIPYLEKNTFNKHSKKPISASWDVPDIRLINPQRKQANYKNAWLVSQPIDRNTRLATIVTRKNKLTGIRRELKGERVERVKVQNYHPSNKDEKNASFWKFVFNNTA